MKRPSTCPCGLKRPFDDCCGRYLTAGLSAPTAEALMRSRYSAYALGDVDYLRQTWHPDTCPPLRMDPKQQWIGLRIKGIEAGQAPDTHGIVEFVARFRIDGRAHRLHERSEFTRIDGHWIYVRGEANPAK